MQDIDAIIKAKGRLAMVEGALMTGETPQKVLSAIRIIDGYLEVLLKGDMPDVKKERELYDRRERF